jgi:hypothetical protein
MRHISQCAIGEPTRPQSFFHAHVSACKGSEAVALHYRSKKLLGTLKYEPLLHMCNCAAAKRTR